MSHHRAATHATAIPHTTGEVVNANTLSCKPSTDRASCCSAMKNATMVSTSTVMVSLKRSATIEPSTCVNEAFCRLAM